MKNLILILISLILFSCNGTKIEKLTKPTEEVELTPDERAEYSMLTDTYYISIGDLP